MALTKITSRILDSSGVTILGTIATGVWQGTPIADDHIASAATWNTASTDRLKWDGGATGLTASTGRTSLGLGTVATTAASDYATAAQGTKADTAHGWGNHTGGGYVKTTTDQTIAGVKTFSGAVNVTSADDTRLKLTDTGDLSELIFRSDGANTQIYTNTAHDLGIYTVNNVGQLHLKQSTGNVGIGTDSPDARFSVVSSSPNSTAARIGGIEYGGSQRGLTIKTFQSLGGDDCGVEFNAAEGLATYGSFVFKADTAERLRISSGGDVGIGTDDPSSLLSLGNAIDAQKLLLYDDSNFFKYGFGIQTAELRQFFPNSATAKMTFGTISDSDGTTYSPKLTISSGGDVGVGLSTTPTIRLEVEDTVDNWVGKIYNKGTGATAGSGLLVRSDANASDAKYVLGVYADGAYKMVVDSTGLATFSNGIKFGGTPSPAYHSGADTLDAYEEGTWTQTISAGYTSVTYVANETIGSYTRIGNIVTAFFYIRFYGTYVSGGSLVISGLPYAVNNNRKGGAITYTNLALNKNTPTAYPSVNSIYLYSNDIGSAGTLANPTADANAAYIIGSVTYGI